MDQISHSIDLIDDVVYKDLLKEAINRLCELSKINYNTIINKLGKFGDHLSKFITEDPKKILMVLEICNYTTRRII